MKVGIVGLGLIGGSLARAFRKSGCAVYGCDRDKKTEDFALLDQSIAGTLDLSDPSSQPEVILIAITPRGAEEWLQENASAIAPGTLVIDCCGIKRDICATGFALAAEYGFDFVGGHPMAGLQFGGYKNSRADLFANALFVLVPPRDDICLLERARNALRLAGFKRFAVMTAAEHDLAIAFTSQMAHLVSNAYIKSDHASAAAVTAVTGGAFRDMTRVAYLDETMWTELFLANRENLLPEIDGLLYELGRYREAIASHDQEALWNLLREGKERKKELEGHAGKN
ncbi:MAG: prephenate dehydrogenase [Clostridia bacterium]|nr:prephenate dehydrogenase [Clostridia bacterium]